MAGLQRGILPVVSKTQDLGFFAWHVLLYHT